MSDIDEHTPLLSARRCEEAYLLPVVQRHSILSAPVVEWDNPDQVYFSSHTTEKAFQLVLYLYLRSLRLRAIEEDSLALSLDPVERRRRERDNHAAALKLESLAHEHWLEFVEGDDNTDGHDIEDVLWTEIMLSPNSSASVRVLDLVLSSPSSILSDTSMINTLQHTWNNGLSDRVTPDSWWYRHYERHGTPRVMHSLHLAFDLTHLGLVISYLLHPTFRGTHAREVLIALYSLSSLLWFWSPAGLPHLLVLLAFLIARSISPVPDTLSFLLLIISVALRAYYYHLPYLPGPIYLFNNPRPLLISCLLHWAQNHIFIPVLVYFLPILLLSLFLLSFSINDTFLALEHIPAPMQTRVALLTYMAIILLLFLCSLFTISTHSANSSSSSPWEKYGPEPGHMAQKALTRSLVFYTPTPHRLGFPPPFNLLRLVIIGIPGAALRAPSVVKKMERVLWRVSVGPLVLIFSMAWKGVNVIQRVRYHLGL